MIYGSYMIQYDDPAVQNFAKIYVYLNVKGSCMKKEMALGQLQTMQDLHIEEI